MRVAGRNRLTRCLNKVTSSSVKVSDLAITGIKLTLVCSRLMNSTSIGLSLPSVPVRWFDGSGSRVTGRLYEVDTSVNTIIDKL